MCVAVIKPRGSELPTETELSNCYKNNPHGCGYMYLDNGKLHIKKGFMDFDSFYKSFKSENFSKDDVVFIHFRIATHGLIDGGNTHPFPITSDTKLMRETDYSFNGFGMIHNGVFHYDEILFQYFDPTNVISDTMLFAKLVDYSMKCDFDDKDDFVANMINNKFPLEKDIATILKFAKDNYYNNNKDNQKIIGDLYNYIDYKIGFSKVAIMSDDGWFFNFGDWIEHNGCLYSNYDYADSSFSFDLFHNGCQVNFFDDCCSMCGKLYTENELVETTAGMVCKDCLDENIFYECECCGLYDLVEDRVGDQNLCKFCREDINDYCCDFCHKKSNYYKVTDDNKLICGDCYKKYNN